MNILSLFNGISGLHLACDRAGINVDVCYYSEIDKYANKVTEHHYPNDIALGDVTKWREWDIDWSSIDLVGAGFPCQAWSVAGQQLGDKDERGMLFWTTLEIIKHVLYFNPKAKFLMENVKMKKDFEQYITHHTEQALGHVEKTLINSALVSAQNRQRYYWTNFEVEQPSDKGILLKDIVEHPMDEKYNLSDDAISRFKPCQKTKSGQVGTTARDGSIGQRDRVYDADGKMVTLTATIYKQPPQYAIRGGAIRGRYIVDGKRQDHKMKTAGLTEQRLEIRKDEKTNTLTTVQKDNVIVFKPCERIKEGNEGHIATATDIKGMDCIKRVYGVDGKAPTLTTMGGGHREPKVLIGDILYRKLTPLECERLQTLPCDWTSMLSNTQRYKSIGNGWTIDVIAHILKHI